MRWGQEVFRFSSGSDVYVDLYELPYAPYDAGERQDRTWYGAPFRPDFGAQRDLTSMWAGFNDLHDSDGHSGFLSGWVDLPIAERVRLYRNGQLLADVASSFVDQVEVGQAGPATGWSATSTPPAVLSIASPAQRLGVHLAGSGQPGDRTCRCWRSPTARPRWAAATAPWPASRSPSSWTCTAGGRRGRATSLSFSTDGGTKWIRVALTELGEGRYRAVLPGGAMVSGRTVGLRASARDAGGGRLDQTLLRAFPVR